MRAILVRGPHSRAAFTLIELLIVIAIMAILASLTLMGFRSAQINSSRARTAAFHRAIMSGLENYHSENGEYPEPSGTGENTNYGSLQFDISGATMLYQALSGDGDDQIKIGSNGDRKASNGTVDTDQEIASIMLKEMPTEMAKKTSGGEWALMDGFGHPFQYTFPKVTTGSSAGSSSSNTINTTYDLWSYAEDDKNNERKSISDKQDVMISGKWIKNW
jgi:prepilin-type N-terminal cleavage/methylation domain-containing protein